MRKLFVVAGVAFAILATLLAQKNENRRTDTLLPGGAIFYLEAKNFHQLLTQWNSSEERRRWLKSDNASVLSQSRLLQRLMQAQTQFATVAGFPVEMNLVNELAGTQSAFAFYEFSTVHFVYATRMEGSRLDQSDLWKSRGSYQTRDAAGIPFYVKTEINGRDSYSVAFAFHDGWLIVATEPGLMAHTLSLLAGQPATSIAGESWYADTVKKIPEQGDLRLVYNLAALRKSPQFRTYWIQRNNTELAAFTSGSADLFEQPAGFEERRVLLRANSVDSNIDSSGLTEVLSHIPSTASFYRGWVTPSRALVKSILQQVVLNEPITGPVSNQNAPDVSTEAAIVGSESDLETRIDETAFQRSSGNSVDELADVVMAMLPKAILHSQMTQLTADQVFVMPESEMAIACGKPDRAALEKTLESSINVTKIGSLDPLRTSVDNGVLLLSRLATHSAGKAPAALKDEAYVANYEHAVEWPSYKRLFGVVDRGDANAPAFFSRNLRSLGDSLYRLRRVSITTQEESTVTRDTVRYEFLTK